MSNVTRLVLLILLLFSMAFYTMVEFDGGKTSRRFVITPVPEPGSTLTVPPTWTPKPTITGTPFPTNTPRPVSTSTSTAVAPSPTTSQCSVDAYPVQCATPTPVGYP